MIDLKSIENIIFDFGGVVINLDFQQTRIAFEKLGFKNFDSYYTQVSQKDLFDKFEVGKITSADFRKGIKELSPVPLSDKVIDEAWNAMLLDLPVERINLLLELKNKFRTFLLSNTNAIHIDHCNSYLKENRGVESMDPFFEKVYYSHLMHMRKPNVEIFQQVIDENKLIPEKTLFIDDTLIHVEGARKAGLNAFHLNGGLTIIDIFAKMR